MTVSTVHKSMHYTVTYLTSLMADVIQTGHLASLAEVWDASDDGVCDDMLHRAYGSESKDPNKLSGLEHLPGWESYSHGERMLTQVTKLAAVITAIAERIASDMQWNFCTHSALEAVQDSIQSITMLDSHLHAKDLVIRHFRMIIQNWASCPEVDALSSTYDLHFDSRPSLTDLQQLESFQTFLQGTIK